MHDGILIDLGEATELTMAPYPSGDQEDGVGNPVQWIRFSD